ncbi:hypothetical protein V1517DRAFT_307735 [Lipomyces orientalis]|uniref:Uncharacterized protein n=1 Tax=Lipomyces orientalis TaxID=1233043 RepID=A0ACC3TNU7_9ASCO
MSGDLSKTLGALKPSESYPSSHFAREKPTNILVHAESWESHSRVDPATITTLEDAIDYINVVIVGDGNSLTRIRRMRKHQDDHELQWYAGRVAIIEKHEKRREVRLKLRSMLSLVGGDTSETTSEEQAVENERRELTEYDKKVHNASIALVKSMSLELADMRVPFFCNGIPYEAAEADLKLSANRRQVVERLEEITSETA